ncbi:MAG: hypothetical protein IKN59_03765 [Paludibacteraceae bacterium]|nr:hypothetical protein [Paludibacteraceae bacterium]
MKKLMMVAMALIMAVSASVYAQDAKEVRKQRQQVARLAKSELKEKASKEARKEAKGLEKEGWTIFPGDLPLAKQLDRSYAMEYEYVQNAAGSIVPKYLVGRGMATGENYSAAQNAAVELAKQYVAGLAEIDITTITETTLANKEQADATSIAEVVSASKNIVSKKIGEIAPIVTLRKEVGKGKVSVLVRVVYDRNTILNTYKQAIREELQKKGDKLHEQLDDVLGF